MVENSHIEQMTTDEQAQERAIERGYFDGAIPSDIPAPPSLSPKRGELARFLEWRRRTTEELEHLEEAHRRAIEALGGQAKTKKKIEALLDADTENLLKFALGGESITPAKVRAFERQQLEAKLEQDGHTAEVATRALGEIELNIATKTIAIFFLESRVEKFMKPAVIEAAGEFKLGERYLAAIWGLGCVVGSHDDFCRGPVREGVELQFMSFGLPPIGNKQLTITTTQKALDAAAADWRALGTKLIANSAVNAATAYRPQHKES
jgi:hypothetical protein